MEAEYEGTATLISEEREIWVNVHLSGQVQPIDGTYRWGGRIAAQPELQELAAGRARTVTVRTSESYSAQGALGEQDPWGGCRISGTGAPPFAVPTHPDELEGDP